MTKLKIVAAFIGMALPLGVASAHAADIKVLSSTAVKSVLQELGSEFEKVTENKLIFTIAPAAVLKTQIEQGAAFDVAVLTAAGIDDLTKQGKIDPSTRAVIARAGLGVSLRAGAPMLDVSTADALKRALLAAKSIGFNGQGASKAGIEAMIVKLGIADELKSKIVMLNVGAPEAVAKGEVEMGLGPVSEIIQVSSTEVVGAFPAELQNYLVFSGGVAAGSKAADAANSLIKFLVSPAAVPVLKTKGLQPG
ncbi:MAG TPA: molybdate ABC transporter substrate-binding protein [Xanthobacteraceae bacterium]|jgi:molybdate transport system substrate-binding protein|nr:molybdate ABC transporter substrate-binding protein [Xanthobacteraceae bacterium]